MTTIRRATLEIDDVPLPDGKKGRLSLKIGGLDRPGILHLKVYGEPLTCSASVIELAAYLYGDPDDEHGTAPC